MKRKVILWMAGLMLAWAVFFIYGLYVHGRMAGARELYGYDYLISFMKLRSWEWVTYTGLRHPGLGLLMSPVVLLAAKMSEISLNASEILVLVVMAVVAVGNLGLVWRIGGWIAAGVMATFGFFWINASCPDSFPIAMATMLMMLWWVNLVSGGRQVDENLDLAIWAVLFILASAVTVTNGLKVVIAYLIVHRLTRKQWMWLVAGGVGLLLLVAAFFWVRMLIWNAMYPQYQKTIVNSIALNMQWINGGFEGGMDRWRAVRDGFLIIPILPRLAIADVVKPAAVAHWEYAWAAVVYGAAMVGVWRGWRDKVVQVCLGCFVVDVAIHVVCGWGLNEAWIFAPHWFWLLPICIGRGFRK